MNTQATTSCLGPSNPDLDSHGGWNNVSIITKIMQGQKKALKVQQRITTSIPLRGFGGAFSSNCFTIITNASRGKKNKNKKDDDHDSTDSIADDPSDPPAEGQMFEALSLGTASETPISQALSLPRPVIPDNE